jgi:hypothetical protein
MKLNIRDFSIGHLLNMRHDIRDNGWKMRFTVAEINEELDRRSRLSTPLSIRQDVSIYTP